MKKKLWTLFTAILVLSMLFSGGAMASNSTQSEPPEENLVVARVYFGDQANLGTLARYLDIWEVNHSEGYLVAMLSPVQLESLQQGGYQVIIDEEKTALLSIRNTPLPGQGPDTIPGYPCYRTVEETYNALSALAAANPNLAEWIDIGDSWDKVTPGGPAGYDIWALRLTNESIPGPKPTFFLMAEIHAREYVTAETAARYAEHLVANYGSNPDITWLLDYFQVYIVAMTNPDGRKFAEAGEWWRKNTDNDDGCTIYPNYGTDLNRNHSFHWGGAGTNPCGETYQGPSAASEPETQAIQTLVLSLFPDQRGPGDTDPAPLDTTGLFITLHSYSELVLWPWGWTPTDAPNHVQLRTLGRKLAYYNNYFPQQSNDLYATTGTSDDWAYGELGIAAYTYEMGTSFFQSCSSFESTIYPTNLASLLYAFKAARLPYMNPSGPDVLNVAVSPTSVPAGTPVQLTAVANDTRFNNQNGTEPTQNIAEARYSIDDPSWISGTPTYPMSATDGSFNETIEDVQATVNTSQLSAGQHIIFVESRDAAGNWGSPSAVFLNITSPQYGVSLTPETANDQGDPGETVSYNLQVHNFGQNSDTYNVVVESNWPVSAPATVGPVSAGGTTSLLVEVTVPLTATHGESDTATVTVVSQAQPSIEDSATLVTTANYYEPGVDPSSENGTGFPGTEVAYTLALTNLGNITDTFDLAASGLWPADLPASLGPLGIGESIEFVVTVTIPPDAEAGDSELTTVTIASQGNPAQTAQALLTTEVGLRGPGISPTQAGRFGNPGTTVSYTFQVTNLGPETDTFNITVLNADWPTTAPASVGPLGPGASTNIQVQVTIPAEVPGGTFDDATLRLTSPLPGSVVATANMRTTANSIYGVAAVAEVDAQTIHASATPVTYTLLVTNTGNTTDTFNVAVTTAWQASYQATVGPLGPGDSTILVILIYAPAGIPSGQSDVALVTLTSQGNPNRQAQIALTTTTAWFDIYIPLSQKH